MGNLYIFGKNDKQDIKPSESDLVYYLEDVNTDNIGTCLNDPRKIDLFSLELRDEYVEYINSINESFVKNDIIYENTISTFFFSDLFNKRSEIFDTYISICHLVLLKEKISSGLIIDKIVALGCTDRFLDGLNSVFPDLEVFALDTKINKTSIIIFSLKQIKFYIKTLIQIIIIKIFYRNKYNGQQIEKLFLTRYPLHLNNSFIEDKYGRMVKPNDWYLISMITDGMHQSINIFETFLFCKNLNKRGNRILIDDFMSVKDIFVAFWQNIFLTIKFRKLIKNHKYYFKGINLSKFINKEIEQSFLRFPRLFMYRNALIKVFSKHVIRNFIFYLHEYSYGRFINYILCKYFPEMSRTAIQSGPASRRKMLYFLGKEITSANPNDWKYKTPIPHYVLAEDELSKRVYLEAGYENIKLMDTVYRLDYLRKINRKNKIDNMVLIAPGLHDGLPLLNSIKNIIKQQVHKLFILKPHPRSQHFPHGIPPGLNFSNLEFGKDHISQYLGKASEVIVTYSSVGPEAYSIGIPVTLVPLSNRINESPILDYYLEDDKNLITYLD